MKSLQSGLLSVLAVTLISARLAGAQTPAPTSAPELTGSVLTSEGINGDVDKYRRDPLVSVGIVHGVSVVSLRVDATITDTDYTKYPIQFSFFVNRKLFSTQMRSPALPGAIGVDIPSDVAVPPFNYTIVATLLHPNRQFTTIIEGAVFGNNLVATLDCTLTLPAVSDATPAPSEDSEIFTENSVTTTQSGENVFSVAMSKAENASNSETVALTSAITVNVSDNSAKGTLLITQDGSQTSSEATGKITVSAGNLASVSLTSSDGNTILSCS